MFIRLSYAYKLQRYISLFGLKKPTIVVVIIIINSIEIQAKHEVINSSIDMYKLCMGDSLDRS